MLPVPHSKNAVKWLAKGLFLVLASFLLFPSAALAASKTITASAGSGGTISPSGSVSVTVGNNKTFTITPDATHQVSSVLVDGAAVSVPAAGGTYTFNNVTTNHTIAASFALKTFTITASAGAGGSISPSGTVTVTSGLNQLFTVTPNVNYKVASVLVDGAAVSVPAAGGTYTFNNVTTNHTITASFVLNTYTITASAGAGGSITPSGTVSVTSGTNKTFTITPNATYKVTGVLVDGSPASIAETGGTYTFSGVTANHTIAASFALKTYTITATAGTGGAISPSGSVTVNHGSSPAFTVTPNTGYSVLSVLVDGTAVTVASTGGTYTFTNVTTDHAIVASFVLRTFTITASAGTGGTISPSGTQTVNYGDSPSYTITASTGYSLNKVTVDGTEINLTGGTYSFSAVNANHTITATFKGGGGGSGGSSYIPGCSASTYTSYSNGFNSLDFTMANTAVTDSKIVLQTGAMAIVPSKIIVPFTQEVTVTFLYEGAGYISDMGWLLYSDCVDSSGNFLGWANIPHSKRHPLFIKIEDDVETGGCCGGGNGVLDTAYGNGGFPTSSESALATYDDGTGYKFKVDGDGSVTPKDMKKSLGTITGGSEIVFFLTANKRWSDDNPTDVFFTKTDWNPDTYQACTPTGYVAGTSFNKVYDLGSANTTEGTCTTATSGWLSAVTIARMSTSFGITLSGTVTLPIVKNQRFPHVIVGAPADDPNQWILGFEDLMNGGDYDINDMAFRIERRTGGTAQLQSTQAITPVDPDAYFTSVNIEVYDNMPCPGKTNIKYSVSIDDGINWVEITDWDQVKNFSGSGSSKVVGADVQNWTPGNPAKTYRLRRIDFSGKALVGRQLIWKAEMTSDDEACVPEIIDVVLDGSVATHGSFSRASPSVQTNMIYSGSYETPAISWTEKVLRGHLYATRLYDPQDPSQENIVSKWDAGEVLTAMSPASRNIKYPSVTLSAVTNEVIATGNGTQKHFSGTLAHSPISATTVKITDQTENVIDKHTDVLEGDMGGAGTINRFTGVYDLTFHNPPGNNVPVVAQYSYYTASSVLKDFTPANVTNAMLGLDSTYIVPTGYKYDLNHDGLFTEADGDWLVNWVRGYTDGAGIKKEWLLGAVDHSVPAVETPPGRPAWYFGTSVSNEERLAFDQFVHDQYQRSTVVYVGSRDGMLHAFDGGSFRWGYYSGSEFIWGDNPDTTSTTETRGYFESENYGTGTELWAFIPANLMSRLKNNLLSGDDQAYVDASPALSDVEINGVWRTILLSAEGDGGDTVFCLDVTQPNNPTFLWEFADPDLYRSRSSPAVAVIGRTILNGTKKWVAFFVSGKTYDNSLYPSIYMIDIADGSVLKRIFLESEPNGIGGVPSGQPAVVDSDGNGYIDRIYIGTDKGYLYKVTIPDNPSGSSSYGITECVINRDFTDNFGSSVASSQQYHPIYASPAVVVDNTYASDGTVSYKIEILFGTGDSPYYDENINTADTTYHFFAYVDTAEKGVCNSSSVYLDWLYELPAGERVFASAFAAAGSIYFGTATSETEDPCESAGNAASNAGKLYVMNISPEGSATPTFTMSTGNILSAPVVDDQHLYVKTVGNGLMTTPGPYNNPVVMGGLVETTVATWREIFGKDESLVPSP